MKKLSVEEEVKHKLIEAKYQYPATCTTYKNGIPTSSRVVTHNEKATKELRELYPELKVEIDRITDISVKSRNEMRREKLQRQRTSKMFPDKNVWKMMFNLGKD